MNYENKGLNYNIPNETRKLSFFVVFPNNNFTENIFKKGKYFFFKKMNGEAGG